MAQLQDRPYPTCTYMCCLENRVTLRRTTKCMLPLKRMRRTLPGNLSI